MRRGIAALVVLLVVVGVATAAQARSRATVTVSLAGWSAGADEDNLLKQVVASFMKSHPGIKVDYSVINGDYKWIGNLFMGQNADALISSITPSAIAPAISAQQALLVMAAYLVGLLVVAGGLLRLRDVT